MIEQVHVDNQGVGLVCLWSSSGSKCPLVMVPGLSESAGEYEELVRSLPDNPTLVVGLRGRGPSDSPPSGYSLEDHVSDIGAAVSDVRLQRPCVAGFSRGGAYATAYALAHSERTAGLVLGEFLNEL